MTVNGIFLKRMIWPTGFSPFVKRLSAMVLPMTHTLALVAMSVSYGMASRLPQKRVASLPFML